MTTLTLRPPPEPVPAEETMSLPLMARPRPANDVSPMELVTRAVEKGADLAMVKELLALRADLKRSEAREAFEAALAAAKAEIPVIAKNRAVGFDGRAGGRTSYRYEDLAEIDRTVKPILSRHGITYRWRTNAAPGEPITVTCVLSGHGHCEENSLSASGDTSGSKNAIQALGSTVTYLERYTLKAALGLSSGEDDDGRAAGSEFITDKQVAELEKLIRDTGGDIAKFCAFAHVETLAELPAAKFDVARSAIIRAGEQRKAQRGRP